MLKSVEVRGYRGLKHLKVENLGRVNLIVGKNDSGKTSLLEVLAMGNNPSDVASMVLQFQSTRRVLAVSTDFENFWKSVFHSADAERGFDLKAEDQEGTQAVAMKRTAELMPSAAAGLGPGVVPTWVLLIQVESARWSGDLNAYSVDQRMVMPFANQFSRGVWSHPATSDPLIDQDIFSALTRQGFERVVEDLLKNIEPDLQKIRILTLGGQSSINVQTAPDLPLLPLAMMGAGFQRCFDIAICLASTQFKYLCIDEVDNGLHHSLLQPVWRWIATASRRTGAQVNLTTHSDECVAAAARVFQELGDDGLRVIRIDRGKDGSRAVVYDSALIATAVEKGIEVRG